MPEDQGYDATDQPLMAQGLYEQLATQRQTFLNRARAAAELTIPFLVPPEGDIANQKLRDPFQSIGARGVNNLASKLLLSLFPPNTPFFKLVLDRFEVKKIEQQGTDLINELNSALGEVERAVVSEIETSDVRVSVFSAIEQEIVAGNALLFVPREGAIRMFRLDRYVIKRDPNDNVLKIIVKESVSPSTIPANIRQQFGESDEKSLDLYTVIQRGTRGKSKKVWNIHQEVKDIQLEHTRGWYPIDESPWIPLRFYKIDGEDYGRGFVEHYMGDLISLEGLMQAMVEGAAAAAKLIHLVNPNSTTRLQDLQNAANGDFIEGNALDITTLQQQKFADFQVVFRMIADIRDRLSFAFLLNSSVQRSGERVTASEINFVSRELETTLAGAFSLFSTDLQLPLVNALMHRMEKSKRLPKLPKKIVKPTVVTGIDGLGRGQDLARLDAFIRGAGQDLSPEVMLKWMNIGNYLLRRATAAGVDTEGLIKTGEEVDDDDQNSQMAQMIQNAGPQATAAIGQILKESVKNQQQGQGPVQGQGQPPPQQPQ